jgi:uncharacterized integral membrane protein (TIGR00697 family)
MIVMNEVLFFLHIGLVVFFALSALALGRIALIASICLQGVLANLFVLKQINLFGLSVTCGNVFIVGSVLTLNLLQEYYGAEIAKKAIYISFFSMMFYLAMSLFQVWYIPNTFDYTHIMFSKLLGFMPRITLSSLCVHFLALKCSQVLYAFFKKRFSKKYVVLRNMMTITISQLLDTVLFTLLALYGVVESVVSVMMLSFAIKMIIIVISTPFVGFSKRFFRGDNVQV